MKRNVFRLAVVVVMLTSTFKVLGQNEVYLGVDYIDVRGTITASGSGDRVDIPFIVYGGTTVDILINTIESSIEQAGCGEWLTNIEIRDFHAGSEGIIRFRVEENIEAYRSVWLVSTDGRVLLEQPVRGSSIYSLTSSKSSIVHGESVTFTLSGSDDFALYRLNRTNGGVMTTVLEKEGTGRPLTFSDYHIGVFTAESFFPSQVSMTGSRTVSYLSFYGFNHTSTSSGAIIDKDGGQITIPFTPHSSASVSQMLSILTTYSEGRSLEWDSTMDITYSSGMITVTAGPNIGGQIDNNTWFKNSNGNEIHFIQDGGGSLRIRGVHITGDVGLQYLSIDSSQFKVRYYLCLNDEPYGVSQEGTGGTLFFNLPQDAGEYGICAEYCGTIRKMQGGVIVTSSGLAMTKDSNWILSSTSRDENGMENNYDITYYDGMGYPEQVIQVMASPSGKNIVTPVWYDSVRRSDARVYLPYESQNSSPSREPSPWSSQVSFYTSEYGSSDAAMAYREREYEASPLDRVIGEWQPGSAHRTAMKKEEVAYGSNVLNEVLLLRCADEDSLLLCNSYYPSGQLNKVTHIDEDGRSEIIYTDLQNRKILVRNLLSPNDWADTYYVYNNRGLLSWIVTPEGSKLLTTSASWPIESANADKWCYRYRYDGKGRIVTKRVPGKAAEYLVYDPAGRIVASQDGELRKNGRWLLIKYDNQGRETEKYITGTFSRYVISSAFQSSAYPSSIYGAATNILISEIRYGTAEVGDLAFSPVNDIVTSGDLYTGINKTLKTYEKLAEMSTIYNTIQYTRRSFFYDDRGRLRQSVDKGSDGGVLRISQKYDYLGNVVKRAATYTKGGFTKTITSTFQYDNRCRLITECSSLDGTTTMVQYGYDNIGRKQNITYGNGMIGTVNYNIQGWQTTQSVSLSSSNIYSQTLAYYSPTKGSNPRYSGFVSEWMTKQGDMAESTYGLVYDYGGRITACSRFSGTDEVATSSYTEKDIIYDANGNIIQIKRYDTSLSQPAQYSYAYNGNLLTSVNGQNYTYDANGNTFTDGLNSFTLEYSPLNMLTKVKQGSNTMVNYSYLSDGTKIKALDGNGEGIIFAGPFVLSTADSGATVSFSCASTGCEDDRIVVDGGGVVATYYIRDHLGSVRTIVSSTGTILERNDYYPFGKRHTTGNNYPVLATSLQKFNGKDIQHIGSSYMDYIDYGARMYDPIIARWLTQDPLLEKYYSFTPYNYCVGNPVLYVDEDGEFVTVGAILTAAVVGASVDIIEQTIVNFLMGEKITSIDISSVLTSAIMGGVGFGSAIIVKRAKQFGKLVRGPVKIGEGIIENICEASINGNISQKNYENIEANIAYDVTVNAVGHHVRSLMRSGSKMRVLKNEADHALRVARGPNPRPSRKMRAEKAEKKMASYGNKTEEGIKMGGDTIKKFINKLLEENEKK